MGTNLETIPASTVSTEAVIEPTSLNHQTKIVAENDSCLLKFDTLVHLKRGRSDDTLAVYTSLI